MTGLETAIILVAFVITAAAFAFVVLNMGFLTAQKSQTVISAGLQEASSSLQCDGDIIGTFNAADNLTSATFYVRLSQGHEAIDTANTKLIMTYQNPRGHTIIYDDDITAVTTITNIVGDTDSLIEYGERWRVVVDFTAVNATADFIDGNGWYTQPYETFRIELRPATGSVLTIERSVPAITDLVMVLE